MNTILHIYKDIDLHENNKPPIYRREKFSQEILTPIKIEYGPSTQKADVLANCSSSYLTIELGPHETPRLQFNRKTLLRLVYEQLQFPVYVTVVGNSLSKFMLRIYLPRRLKRFYFMNL